LNSLCFESRNIAVKKKKKKKPETGEGALGATDREREKVPGGPDQKTPPPRG